MLSGVKIDFQRVILVFKRKALLLCALISISFFSCAVYEQTQICKQFVRCVGDLDLLKGMNTNTKRFEADGGCWGSEAGSELCSGACERGLVVVRKTEVSVPASCAQ